MPLPYLYQLWVLPPNSHLTLCPYYFLFFQGLPSLMPPEEQCCFQKLSFFYRIRGQLMSSCLAGANHLHRSQSFPSSEFNQTYQSYLPSLEESSWHSQKEFCLLPAWWALPKCIKACIQDRPLLLHLVRKLCLRPFRLEPPRHFFHSLDHLRALSCHHFGVWNWWV
jgi:hypothetical protein